MIVLSGPSASGKTEVAKILANKYGITKVITTTTRAKREGETDGVDYFFVSEEKFKSMIKENKFVEYITYNGYYYGSTKDQIKKDKCIATDLNGLKTYASFKNKDIVTFFLQTHERLRYKRMINRGDGRKSAKERIKNDKAAFAKEQFENIDFFIENENESIEEIADFIYKKYQEQLKKR